MSDPVFSRVAIIGLGLIGGSIATALHKRGLAATVVAFDQNRESLQLGKQSGIITEAADSIPAAVQDSDLIILAVPVLAVKAVLREIPATALITDVGSVKTTVIEDSREVYGLIPDCLVPGHPVAGSEKHGVTSANPDLFENHKVILTPVAETKPSAVERIRNLWRGLGATVVVMTVEHHDRILARTSHLPHLLAYALVDTLLSQDDGQEIFRYAAGGFRDFTRIAGSDPIMWRDIFLANGPAVLEILDDYQEKLEELRSMIDQGNVADLQRVLNQASQARDDYTQNDIEKIRGGS
ncbi:MAG: prephenate dehydrogenase/arogenate dehydrogenase family protein [Gammaproteobacteria bacterium]|nr:prephenate dehydrogenase/arogenate dehydrogenase family protein [Gammaproteobacteria bacterium]